MSTSSRSTNIGLALTSIVLGLGVHFRGAWLGATVRDMIGDALWAAMMMWWVSAAVPTASLRSRAMLALTLCFGVEVSQLYNGAMLDTWRGTTVGRLVLGSGFDSRDLLSYTIGVLLAVGIELAVVRRPRDMADS